MKVSFIKLLSFNTVISFLVYLFMFVLFPEISNYFNCNVIITTKDTIFNTFYSIPVSCDLETYMVGIKNFSSIIEFDYAYQTRPVYILYIKVLYGILNAIIENELILNFLSFFIGHLLIVTLSVFIFLSTIDYLITKDNFKLVYLIAVLFILNPIIKFGLFDPSHQTLILLQFSFSFYLLRKKVINDLHIYLYTFLIGVASLANTTMLLTIFFLLFHKYKKLKFLLNDFKKLLLIVIVLIAPNILWNLYIYSQGYTPYNSSVQYWYQFVWIYGYFFNGFEYINFDYNFDEYYCMSIPLFLKCYISDFFKALLYLSLPIFVSVINFIILRKNSDKLVAGLLKDLLLIFTLLFSFWAFIGWYPPLRFNLYSLGFLVTFLISIQIIFLPRKDIVIPEAAAVLIYLIYLNHWNYLGILILNYGLIISILIFLIFVIYISIKKIKLK